MDKAKVPSSNQIGSIGSNQFLSRSPRPPCDKQDSDSRKILIHDSSHHLHKPAKLNEFPGAFASGSTE
ncbi:hypothetical protein E2C01_018874 [Portunus trituberculatus]|uniref:Uncharacterized protein n=1 Tax=Portunus trituberculatus TaxID=210409 RepID=A0A5B7DVQ9_PORTR|nr:hypothetical protein [Portunus trituberculatus]